MKKNIFLCYFCKSREKIKWGEYFSSNKLYGKKTDLVECEKCGIFYAYPTPNEKDLSIIYSKEYHYRPNKFIDTLLYYYTSITDLRPDASLIKQHKNYGKILDIGAGRGDFLSHFSGKNFERWAYDPYISKSDVKMLIKKIGKNINLYSSIDKFPESFFDVIILRNTIEHTTDFSLLLKSIQKLLKKDGILFIRTPNIESADFKSFKTNWYEITMPGHIVFFGSKSIKKVLEKFNYTVRYCRPVERSFPLSFQRSVPLKVPYPLLVFVSVLYSFISPLLGNGGDLRVIASKVKIRNMKADA
jgi:2-polyprenyl-3-methyl-5-hydroxy-6-metoxy-1,4-benzoquinol methylase